MMLNNFNNQSQNMQALNMPYANNTQPFNPEGMTGQQVQGMPSSSYQMNQNHALYVGNLSPELDDMTLYSEFAPYGKIFSVRIMKNTYTNKSRGFGYVTYEREEQAEAAQKAMNNKEIFKREIRVQFKNNMKNLNPLANLVVKNLAKSITSKQLTEECEKFGNVISCFVRKTEIGGSIVSLGYGYVQFEKEEEALEFKNYFNGREINGEKVLVEIFVPYKKRKHQQVSNLYIKNFEDSLQKKEIETFIDEKFSDFGEITSKGVFQDPRLQKYYAFVAYKEPRSAQEAQSAMNNLNQQSGQSLYVSLAQPKSLRKKDLKSKQNQMKNETNMYIRSVKGDVTIGQMKDAFGKYGLITSVCLKPWNKKFDNFQEEKQQMQFGFVNYANPEDAMKLFMNYKTDHTILSLVDLKYSNETFLFYAQNKQMRKQFLRMNRKHMQEIMMKKMMYQQNQQAPNMMMNQPMMPLIDNQMHQMPPQNLEILQNPFLNQLENCTYDEQVSLIKQNMVLFEEMEEEIQKNILGSIMFHKVQQNYDREDFIPKITGMLIDKEVLNLEEIVEIMENDETLRERIEEAIEVIMNC